MFEAPISNSGTRRKFLKISHQFFFPALRSYPVQYEKGKKSLSFGKRNKTDIIIDNIIVYLENTKYR